MWAAVLAEGSLVYQQAPKTTAKKANTSDRNNGERPQKRAELHVYPMSGAQMLT
jgi:hypothetical protein